MMQAKPTVPVNCLFQGCYNPEFEAEIRKCKDKCHEYNQLNPNDRESQLRILEMCIRDRIFILSGVHRISCRLLHINVVNQ